MNKKQFNKFISAAREFHKKNPDFPNGIFHYDGEVIQPYDNDKTVTGLVIVGSKLESTPKEKI